jgi:hypothetical protein
MSASHFTVWLSLGVAIVVACIAFLQWLTAREQWRTANNRAAFDLFQKRYEVYQEFRDVVGNITDSKTRIKAAEAAERARFLFQEDVTIYLDQFIRDLLDLESIGSEFDSLQGDDRRKNLDQQRRLKGRIEEFRTKGPLLFGPYIRFDQKIR